MRSGDDCWRCKLRVNIHRMKAPLPDDGQRLAKCVAALKNCSRREAEQYIEGGWVRVNGQVVEEPQARVTNQTVEIDKNASLLELVAVTLLLHKPPGFDALAAPNAGRSNIKPAQQLLSTATHFANDASGVRPLKRHLTKLEAGLPLETAASGLVVFTQDWRVSRKLAEDAHLIEQELMVEVAGEVAPEVLKRLNQGLLDDGKPLPAVKVSASSTSDTATILRVAVKGAHPGLIAYLFERVGLEIKTLKRIRIGRVSMTQLPVGQWRYLAGHERF
jgi:23S rRNA pseudouridine2604 synthase